MTRPGDVVEIVVVGGVDPGGGAGVFRDVATAGVLGARARVVGTAWTEQDAEVHEVEPRPPELVRRGVELALARRPVAVKIGMAVGPATMRALIEALAGYGGPVVVDPVLATSRGRVLWAGEARDLLPLARRATLVTPNAAEAAALAGASVSTIADAEAAGRRLVERDGLSAVLIKGGHLPDHEGHVVDVLVTAGAGSHRFLHPRTPGASPRGTGCALATAIAVELGRGQELGMAIEDATCWLALAIENARPVGAERHI